MLNKKIMLSRTHWLLSAARSIIENGASGFVLKRCMGADLFAAIDCVQAGRIFISPAVEEVSDHLSPEEGE
jgi:DNA-binding NarL/FixJ family response regulator